VEELDFFVEVIVIEVDFESDLVLLLAKDVVVAVDEESDLETDVERVTEVDVTLVIDSELVIDPFVLVIDVEFEVVLVVVEELEVVVVVPIRLSKSWYCVSPP
jgi:hypothetical protein